MRDAYSVFIAVWRAARIQTDILPTGAALVNTLTQSTRRSAFSEVVTVAVT